jgi:hypothetical protein
MARIPKYGGKKVLVLQQRYSYGMITKKNSKDRKMGK